MNGGMGSFGQYRDKHAGSAVFKQIGCSTYNSRYNYHLLEKNILAMWVTKLTRDNDPNCIAADEIIGELLMPTEKMLFTFAISPCGRRIKVDSPPPYGMVCRKVMVVQTACCCLLCDRHTCVADD